ncbi:hypothetical protein XOC_3282 [Xanthomonas oryzae pv. oryzicola BLS256]|uniref:Uncharacterized protein n=1 Tax=Xanthomonas oryzae pv. oryzicola (strain BLS256) TaxID=383407 RepID=G7TBW7_XANOB|nr:hypothetical protein XOC_3282 [Xanthomonas oryzae pv. oryzicola BLS256]
MMETNGRAVRQQPSIMRQRRVRINHVVALSHADPCTTGTWLGQSWLGRRVSDAWIRLTAGQRTVPCAAKLDQGWIRGRGSHGCPLGRPLIRRCAPPSPGGRRNRRLSRQGDARWSSCITAAHAWPTKKISIRLTPFAALARCTDRGAVHGDLGLFGCCSSHLATQRISHATSQPHCARLVAERLLARTGCIDGRALTRRICAQTRATAAT